LGFPDRFIPLISGLRFKRLQLIPGFLLDIVDRCFVIRRFSIAWPGNCKHDNQTLNEHATTRFFVLHLFSPFNQWFG
jgi:hypothetical protein